MSIEASFKNATWGIEKIKPYEKNAKIHDDKQIEKLASAIEEFGFNQPIVVDENGVILAGHGRRLAAIKLGMKKVPVSVVSNLSEQQKKAYRISDNMVARGEYDDVLLGMEIALIASGGNSEGLDMVDLSLLGMDDSEVNDFLERFAAGNVADDMSIDDIESLIDSESETQTERAAPKDVQYQRTYSVIVDCKGESDQREVYELLTAHGKTCKIQTM